MSVKKNNIHTGSSFDDFLEEEGIRNEVEGAAIKKVLVWTESGGLNAMVENLQPAAFCPIASR